MKTTLVIATLMIALASAFAETDVIPLHGATKRQMQQQAKNAESKRQSTAKAKPEIMDIGQAKALALYAPRPQYPFEARAKHLPGTCVVLVTLDRNTGNVTNAKVIRSTGSPILDNAALSAFRLWRFRPTGPTGRATVPIPVTFSMSGAQY